jgi:hypothetical protein
MESLTLAEPSRIIAGAVLLTLRGVLLWIARLGGPVAAVLMSGGFFASSMGRGVTGPNRFVFLLWVGAISLAAGVASLGIGLLIA